MDGEADALTRALARLEAAVEALDAAAAAPREGPPRAALAALATRLDEGLLRLRAALADTDPPNGRAL